MCNFANRAVHERARRKPSACEGSAQHSDGAPGLASTRPRRRGPVCRQRTANLCRDKVAAALRYPRPARRRECPTRRLQRRAVFMYAAPGRPGDFRARRSAMAIIPSLAPPLPTPNRWIRPLTSEDPFKWLAQGWRDFMGFEKSLVCCPGACPGTSNIRG